MRFRIVGRGRAGGAVATAVVRRGWDEAEPVGHGDPGATLAAAGEDVDLVIIATPDSAIATTAAAIAPSADTVVAHLAGSLGLDALTPHPRRAAVHPLVSLPDSEAGAERLVGKGDMLYLAPGTSTLTRAQGALVTEDEIHDLVTYLTEQASPVFETAITESIENGDLDEEEDITEEDEETLEKCLEVIRQEGKASASMLQRRLRLGYNRASRMMDIMESRGIVGPGEGAKPREILIDLGGDLD